MQVRQLWACTRLDERKELIGTYKQAAFKFRCRLCHYRNNCGGPMLAKSQPVESKEK